jgi:2-phosphosulfolactate phosphatase
MESGWPTTTCFITPHFSHLPHLDVCLTPELLHLFPLKGKVVVVVDILRATSTMVTALVHGIDSIIPVRSLQECLSYREQGCLVAAERDGRMAEEFDLGNSPFSYMAPELKGRKVALTTTNGTQAIALSHEADAIVAGAFLNLSAVARFLLARDQDAVIVCAGWKGQFNLEDTLFAGALCQELQAEFELVSDAARAARQLYHCNQNDLLGAVSGSSHVQRLRNLNIIEDVAFCLTIDKYALVPLLKDGRLVAH